MKLSKVKRYIKLRLLFPFIKYVRKGICPKELALTITLGLTLGVIPFMGVNTLILIVLAIIFRLNHVIVQLVNYSVFPLQLILYLPFLKLGQLVFNGPKLEITSKEFIFSLRHEWLNTIIDIWKLNLLGLLLWLLISIPVGYAIYSVVYYVLRKYQPVIT